MADPRWRTVPDPSLMINDVIMTLLLLLKVINLLPNLLILLDTLLFKYFLFWGEKIDGSWILQINSTIWRDNDIKLPHCVNQVSLYVGNDDYILLRFFEVIEGVSEAPPGRRRQKNPSLHRVKSIVNPLLNPPGDFFISSTFTRSLFERGKGGSYLI